MPGRSLETEQDNPASSDAAQPRGGRAPAEIVGRSAPVAELLSQIRRVAGSDVTVLLEGETGTGKDLVARTIHHLSSRSSRPFITLGASCLPEDDFEAILLGPAGGLASQRPGPEGVARAADGGTLFIDEVGELSPASQATLLHFLDTKEIRPVGGAEATAVDVRILCSTNRDLSARVGDGTFRKDLYYRLRVIALRVPPLRERGEDVAALIDHFLERFSECYGKRLAGLSEEVRSMLLAHRWAGNVRELENEMERAVVMTPAGGTVTVDALSPEIRSMAMADPTPGMSLKEYRQAVERRIMIESLERNGWNVSAASRELGLSRVGLTKKMKRLGVERPDRRS